ncbi:MAG: polyhydroxyalkanoate depolymerase [Alphaproteobacteria bacterium]|nr:MAG: polyhydroxyalkanoate depolymerase [Alphaproteobacteria bacterium]
MLYQLHELKHALMTPLRLQANFTRTLMKGPFKSLENTQFGRAISANATMIERMTRRFERPEFGLKQTIIDRKRISVKENIIVEKPFGTLLNFKRNTKRNDPKVLIVAPMSGHYATLLRGTVEALLPHHDVYITDWEDARQVPMEKGTFDFDDYVTYLREFMSLLGPETHIIAVCQPAVPVLAAISLMATEKDPNQPMTMTLMGGPIDTRVSKTEVTELAETRPLKWFEQSVLYNVPFHYPGKQRRVYPGFLQLSGFMSMNLDTHIDSHMKFYQHLIEGDDDSSERHKKFYNEYLSVMDIPAEFYLQTVSEVFQKHSLPCGKMKWRDPHTDKLVDVRPQDIKHTALLTIEGELDDISARGQTTAAHNLCYSLPQRKQFHHFQLECGHYGIFNGGRWRNQIMPRIRTFIREFDNNKDPVPAADLEESNSVLPERFNHDKHGIVAVRRWLKEHQPENYKDTKIVSNTKPKPKKVKPVQQKKKLVPPSSPSKKKAKSAKKMPAQVKPRRSVTAIMVESSPEKKKDAPKKIKVTTKIKTKPKATKTKAKTSAKKTSTKKKSTVKS